MAGRSPGWDATWATAAPRLREAVRDALATPDAGQVVIDMTEVGFLSSTGLGALVTAHHDADRRGEPLRMIVDHSRPMLRQLQLSGQD